MASEPLGRPRAAAALLLLVSLFAVAVATSRAHLFGDAAPAVGPDVRRTVLDALFYLAILYVAVVMALVVWALWPDESLKATPLPRRSLIRSMVVPLLFTFALAFLWALRFHPAAGLRGPFGLGAGVPSGPSGALAFGGPGAGGPSGVDWAAASIVAALAAGLAYVAWRRRPRASARPAWREPGVLEQAVEEGLAGLDSEPDPRRAVIAAYAGMEAVLAREGAGRRSWEAPLEYLARLLAADGFSSAAASRLTDLFQLARFSEHAVGPEERERALAALTEIRAELAARREARLAPA